jgi:D-galactarolactone isomerase
MPGRRRFLQSLAGLCTAAIGPAATPANPADCHIHIYDSRYPVDPQSKLRPPDASVADYRRVQSRLGTTRVVVVQPSTYGVDNRCLLAALQQFGPSSRGIAVVSPQVSNRELKALQAAGVRGIRFNLAQAGATTLDMLPPLAQRIADWGWHVQINALPDQILDSLNVFKTLPVPVVFDHLAHVARPRDATFQAIAGLLKNEKAWLKLSGAYMDSKAGPPTYADRGLVAKAFLQESPNRLVWGSDWPHPTTTKKPDDLNLLELLKDWCGSATVRDKVLVQNPEKLYGFSERLRLRLWV